MHLKLLQRITNSIITISKRRDLANALPTNILLDNVISQYFVLCEIALQGDPNQNLFIQVAITLGIGISDPILMQTKCVSEVFHTVTQPNNNSNFSFTISAHVTLLVANLTTSLFYLFAGGESSWATFGLALIYTFLFSPASFVCWFRPVYKAFRYVHKPPIQCIFRE